MVEDTLHIPMIAINYMATENTIPYVEAFFKWWESDLHKTLRQLRVTGGESLMSADLWKLVEWFEKNGDKSQTSPAINSNLLQNRTNTKISRCQKHLPKFRCIQ